MSVKKTIAITGGAGYVGSRVAQKLALQGGVRVVILDMGETRFELGENITFRPGDLRIPGVAKENLVGVDLVLHLAADIGSLNYMEEYQADILRNNAAIDAQLYDALVTCNIPKIVYASSSMVFQHPPKFPYTEDDIAAIKPPQNVYGFSKLIGEYFCKAYHAQYSIEYAIIRYHNIYGPGEDAKGSTPGDIHVIPALLEKILSGQYPLQILGSIEATRPFTYIDDAVDATTEIVMRLLEGDDAVKNTDFNIGNDTYYTIGELAEIMWRLFGDGREFKYEEVPSKANTSFRREVDITKIRSILGWEPKVSLEKGLESTKEWLVKRS